MNIFAPVTEEHSQKTLDSFPSNPVSYLKLFPVKGTERIT